MGRDEGRVRLQQLVPLQPDRLRLSARADVQGVPGCHRIAVAEFGEVPRGAGEVEPSERRRIRIAVVQLALQVVLHRVERDDSQVGPADPLGYGRGLLAGRARQRRIPVHGGRLGVSVRPERLSEQQPDPPFAVAGREALEPELQVTECLLLDRKSAVRTRPPAYGLERMPTEASDPFVVGRAGVDQRVDRLHEAAPGVVAQRRMAKAVTERLESRRPLGRGCRDVERGRREQARPLVARAA